jgi:8-oxo-dGTP pyrophosphatase MutT (NUDIX family)
MKNSKDQQILVSGAVIFRDYRGKRQFLLVKTRSSEDWEIPKVTVRKGESSVRAAIRMIGEQGGMVSKVLEEASRSSGSAIINAKSIPQKFYYYLMVQKGPSSELIGFDEFKWVEYGDAIKKVALKREKEAFKQGREVLKEWEKTHSKKQLQF